MEHKINLSEPRYDQSTYIGRLKHFSQLTDPRNLLVSEQEIQKCQRLLAEYKAGKVKLADEEELWRAKKLVDSSMHPDTGELVFLPFRMASFVPTNVPIIAAMLLPNPTTAMIIGFQWLNQSINVAFNYYNANKTTPMSVKETAVAYTGAVVSSCSIALGLTKSLNKAPVRWQPLLGRVIPFCAVAAAGTLNVYLMRRKEIVDGIQVASSKQVYDENNNLLGKSKKAGEAAIKQVAISRIVTAAPALFIPGIIMTQLEKTNFLKRNRYLTIPLNLVTVTASILVALPCAIALFPQKASLETAKVEPEFKSHKRIFFNRGL